jgi:hypothetical protein
MREQDQYPQNQYDIDLSITCPRRHSELVLDDTTAAECLIEELSGLALNTLFDTVWIKNVDVTVAPEREAQFTIVLRAQGIEPLHQASNLEMLIEDKLTCALAELFDSLHVERCAVA